MTEPVRVDVGRWSRVHTLYYRFGPTEGPISLSLHCCGPFPSVCLSHLQYFCVFHLMLLPSLSFNTTRCLCLWLLLYCDRTYGHRRLIYCITVVQIKFFFSLLCAKPQASKLIWDAVSSFHSGFIFNHLPFHEWFNASASVNPCLKKRSFNFTH